MGYSIEETRTKDINRLTLMEGIDNKMGGIPSALKGNYQSNYNGTQNTIRKDNKIKLALIDSRPLTRRSVTLLLETSTPGRRRSEDFAILPFSNTGELLAYSSEDDSDVHLIIFNIGAACVSEVQEKGVP